MKKSLILVAALSMPFISFAQDAAEPVKVGNIYYVFDDATKTATITGPTQLGQIENAAIKSEVENPTTGVSCTVTAIEKNAFADAINLITVSIPSTVKSIGNTAFANCTWMETIEIADGVETIGNGVFMAVGTKVSQWGDLAKHPLPKITLPSSVKSIGIQCFYNCAASEINLNEGLTELPIMALSGTNISSIVIPSTVTTIGVECFNWSPNLTEVTIGKSVTNINDNAFMDCGALEYVTCLNPVPPTLGATVFSTYDGFDSSTNLSIGKAADLSGTVLKVPYGSKAAYEAADTWKEFGLIEELPADKPTGIEDLGVDAAANSWKVYNIAGQLVLDTEDASAVESLPAGLYIINGKKVAIR